MMVSKFSACALFLAAASSVAAAARPYLVVFGNSLSDIGNVEGVTYAVPWWNGRFSNGPVWNEYLAYYNNYTLINYAVGGATSNNTSVNLFTNSNITIPSVPDQLAVFTKTFGGKFSASAIVDDIAVIEIGANDILDGSALEATLAIDVLAYSSSIVSNIMRSILAVQGLGYQKVLVTTIPDIKRTPAILAFPGEGGANVDQYVQAVNSLLSSTVSTIYSANNSTNYVKLVALDTIVDLVAGPLAPMMNITVTDQACYPVLNNTLLSSCDDSNNHLFVDWIHPATKVHALTASVMAQIINSTSFEITEESVQPLIARYNLAEANSRTNFLYGAQSYQSGVINIDSYTIKKSNASASAIISAKNNNSTLNNGTVSEGSDVKTATGGKSSAFSGKIVSLSAALVPIATLFFTLV